jgi:hypothetical protein
LQKEIKRRKDMVVVGIKEEHEKIGMKLGKIGWIVK